MREAFRDIVLYTGYKRFKTYISKNTKRQFIL